ncbi:hypothetical protein [Massilia sp. Leaf139]|uniref:hypothetical protein n=1 Tax=Massilia sp. Leaf139 TaxID=1736272 RepID=UPI000A51A78A|nr:hypothetical protein [Massilia sp. Leaf139]
MTTKLRNVHALLIIGAALLWSAHSRAQTTVQTTAPTAAQPAAQPVLQATTVPDAKTAYNTARDMAAANYKAARARCDTVTGNPREVCVAEAKAERVRVEEEAGAAYKNTLKAYTQARMRIADANYDRDKARCGAVTGNDRDVCIKQAKATLIAARADATADRKMIEARSNAREDKLTAEYRVALEKCDAFAGAAKDQCVDAAKTAYGK